MNKIKKIAGVVRVITVPPIIILLLLIILFVSRNDIFRNIGELAVSIAFLMVIPISAYPLSAVIPKIKSRGREGQRDLAIRVTFVSYGIAVVYGLIFAVSSNLMLIFFTYFVSVVALAVSNKLIKFRASGHACSITGPLVLMMYFIGWKSIAPCILLFALVVWASLMLKRHTIKELIAGSGVAAVSFAFSLLLIGSVQLI